LTGRYSCLCPQSFNTTPTRLPYHRQTLKGGGLDDERRDDGERPGGNNPSWLEHETLLSYLRFQLGLAGVRFGCGVGLCGACTVLLDGRAARACTLPAIGALGRRVITAEGFGPAGGAPAAVLRAWEELAVPQCGYCQSGQMAQAAALLAERPRLGGTRPRRPWRASVPLRHAATHPRRARPRCRHSRPGRRLR
jgi:aerobic-type carbon monoxide dehydrogenase small subunit (CoxS/CutS family)